MITGKNILCFANDWDADPTSKHQVMKVLARHNRVLWVESTGLRRPGANAGDAARMQAKIQKFLKGPRTVAPGLTVLTPLVIPFHDWRGVPTFNAHWLSWYVKRQLSKLGMNPFQFWSFMPTTARFLSHLRPDKVVYYCVDEWSAFTFLNGKLMEQMEGDLIRRSDVVIASAEKLYESKRRLNRHTYLVPHGVDSEHFGKALRAETVVPEEIVRLPRPTIGFWGLIHEWIDLDLVRQVAEQRPQWSFVFVGKVGVDCGSLARRPNVHFPGVRPYESLPAFAKGFTAAILPFKINRLTENVNPIKLREYLAAGLPVVSTPLREAKVYRNVVRFGADAEEFCHALDLAVQDTSQKAVQTRLDAVSGATWEARVEQISRHVEEAE